MTETKPRILIVDDEFDARRLLSEILSKEYEVLLAETGEEALRIAKEKQPDLVLLDLYLPGISGYEVLKELHKKDPSLYVIMISGYGTIDDAVKAVKIGAYDFLEKPLDENRIFLSVKRALNHRELEQKFRKLQKEILEKYKMVGSSKAMHKVYSLIESAAPTDSSVLIRGESGVGKELVACAIHNQSERAGKSLVKLNCAALPENLVESELFGFEKGAFTGATARKKGRLEIADRGTLFLDEVCDMGLSAQAKLLRFLQEGEFEHLGGTETIKVDVRIIAATNKDPHYEIKENRFREDLYYRLNVIDISIPPLRERREDIPLLIEHYLNYFSKRQGVPIKRIDREAMNLLTMQKWPGNVRELMNIIERIVVLTKSQEITANQIKDLMEAVILPLKPAPIVSFKKAREDFERNYILRTLEENQWNIAKVAEVLKLNRTNLYRKIHSLGIELKHET